MFWSKLEEKVYITDVTTARYYQCSEVASGIWEALEQGKPVSEIVSTLVQQYDVSAEIAKRDVLQFIEDLKQKNLLGET